MNKVFLSFIVIYVLITVCYSQELTANEIVHRTIKASGGKIWQYPKTLHLSGTAIIFWDEKPIYINHYKMWRIFPSENDAAHKENGKIRFDAFSDKALFFQISFDGIQTHQELSDAAKRNIEFLKWANNFGFSIFRFYDRPGFKLRRLPDDKIDNFPCYFVKITDATGSDTIFGIDKRRFYIRYAAFSTPIGFHQRFYSKFSMNKQNGFVQPLHLRIYNNGIKSAEVFWTRFKVNQYIPDDLFKL